MPYNPLAEFVAALIRLPFEILGVFWRLLRFLMRAVGLIPGQYQLGPYEKNRRRAVAAVFVLVLCLYMLRTGAWLLAPLPPWAPLALTVVAGVSVLFLLAGLHGARNAPRDLSGVVASLVIAGGCAAPLWGQWYVPLDYSPAADYANRVLPGLYIAALIAAVVRALICVRLLGGAQRIIARAMRQRAMTMRPASASGFWAEMRDSFTRGRAGRPWRD